MHDGQLFVQNIYGTPINNFTRNRPELQGVLKACPISK